MSATGFSFGTEDRRAMANGAGSGVDGFGIVDVRDGRLLEDDKGFEYEFWISAFVVLRGVVS